MNQTIKVTMYSPIHEGLGDMEYIVTGLTFDKDHGSVTFQMVDDTSFDITLDELARWERHDSIPNQILFGLSEAGMSDEEIACHRSVKTSLNAMLNHRMREQYEGYIHSGIERRI